MVLGCVFAPASQAQPLAPFQRMWSDSGVRVFSSAKVTSHGIVGDGQGGAYVVASFHDPSVVGAPGVTRIVRLEAAGNVHPAWPAQGLLVHSMAGSPPAFGRVTLRRSTGGSVSIDAAPRDDARDRLEAIVVEHPSPHVTWMKFERHHPSEGTYRQHVASASGDWWSLALEFDSLTVRLQRTDGSAALGWPEGGLRLDRRGPTATGQRSILASWSPQLLPDGRLGILYEAFDYPPGPLTRVVHRVRVEPSNATVMRDSFPLSPWTGELESWTVDEQGRPLLTLGDQGMRRASGFDWDGPARWSEPLFPDSSYNIGLEALVASDGREGVYVAHTTEAATEWLSELRVLHRPGPDGPASVIRSLAPIPGTNPYRSSAFRLWADAAGRAVLCLHCEGESAYGARGPASVLLLDSSGLIAGSDAGGTRVFPLGPALYLQPWIERDRNGDVHASITQWAGPGSPMQVRAQRLHTDQPVGTLASRISGGRVGGGVELAWQLSGDAATVVRIERSVGDSPFDVFATLAPDGEGRVRAHDAAAPSVARLRYRLSVAGLVLDTWEIPASVQPGLALSLRRVPDGAMSASITLEGRGDARLDVFDVAGRLLRSEDLGDRSAGVHELLLAATGRPGLRLVRLREGGEHRVVRYASLR